jgi:cobalt-zinc-cadmium efflux system protein
VNLALQAVPPGVDPAAVRAYLAALPGVCDVRDLHIWAMSTTETALSVHLVAPEMAGDDAALLEIAHALHDRFAIEHPTIQVLRSTDFPHCHGEGGHPAEAV